MQVKWYYSKSITDCVQREHVKPHLLYCTQKVGRAMKFDTDIHDGKW